MQFNLRSLIIFVGYSALQLAICTTAAEKYADILAPVIFMIAFTVFLGYTFYGVDSQIRAFCIGALLPATIYIFGRGWIIEDFFAINQDRDDPFDEGMQRANVLAILQFAGLVCGILMQLTQRLCNGAREA